MSENKEKPSEVLESILQKIFGDLSSVEEREDLEDIVVTITNGTVVAKIDIQFNAIGFEDGEPLIEVAIIQRGSSDEKLSTASDSFAMNLGASIGDLIRKKFTK